MAIPDYQSIMLPLLQLCSTGGPYTLPMARERLADQFKLTEEERNELLPSGYQGRFDNRVGWARVYLEKAGLLDTIQRGVFEITPSGRETLAKKPQRIDIKFLRQFESFRSFYDLKPEKEVSAPIITETTPEEALGTAYEALRQQVTAEVLQKVKSASPKFFEILVVELLTRMGYGGNRAEAGKAIGASGDEGIDGIISEDRLGLDNIYIQAKRWEGTVGRPEIQKFVGALHGKRARKGVFITTGTFTADAKSYVAVIDPKVVLIDGKTLVEYMFDLNVGVVTRETFELKKIDLDYFVE